MSTPALSEGLLLPAEKEGKARNGKVDATGDEGGEEVDKRVEEAREMAKGSRERLQRDLEEANRLLEERCVAYET